MVEAHKEPQVRRILAGVLLIVLMILAGVLGGIAVRDEPVDLRWATWDQPTVVGELLEDNRRAFRNVTADGIPIASPDNQVTLAFRRCGPVSDVETTSTRTWVVRSDDAEFLGVEGQTVAVTVLGNGEGCSIFDLTYPIPAEVVEACCSAPNSTVELRFTIVPLDPSLGPVVLESEPFRLWETGLEAAIETIDLTKEE